MNMVRVHLIVTEHVDADGRHWCARCRLPDDNARARRAHAAALAWRAADNTHRRYEPDAA